MRKYIQYSYGQIGMEVLFLMGQRNIFEVIATLYHPSVTAMTPSIRNYTTPGGRSGQDIVVVRDPAQIRSRFAAFDPARRSDSDLLAATGVTLPTAGGDAAFSDGVQVMTLPEILGSAMGPLPTLPTDRPPLGPAWAADYHAAYQDPSTPEFAERVAQEAAAAERWREEQEQQAREQAIRLGRLIEA